ncbi:hypothetical protein BJY01DRAFT_218185 [Aspergillus pseudoustus]|uniref:Uncharacterized protein n=1 Tax=Aspergillus pseudoustus TaxID=1810923 RepID=A0ABR4JL91_9EURO
MKPFDPAKPRGLKALVFKASMPQRAFSKWHRLRGRAKCKLPTCDGNIMRGELCLAMSLAVSYGRYCI